MQTKVDEGGLHDAREKNLGGILPPQICAPGKEIAVSIINIDFIERRTAIDPRTRHGHATLAQRPSAGGRKNIVAAGMPLPAIIGYTARPEIGLRGDGHAATGSTSRIDIIQGGKA
ncbi:hypothetical protein [Sideroxyarcus emersonii]|uniref:hypothetical protein n=1 Tax=Sideroxyarcus emersonii TaxID=2764705 RepID=UPI001F3E3516|nr:hypothetical protein [Sideroxyarcus emersonii]